MDASSGKARSLPELLAAVRNLAIRACEHLPALCVVAGMF
jgi:hypothetical protein